MSEDEDKEDNAGRLSEKEGEEPWGKRKQGALRTPITPKTMTVANLEEDRNRLFRWGAEPGLSVFRLRKGWTSRGRLASVAAWAGAYKLGVPSHSTWARPSDLLRESYYRAGVSVGTIVVRDAEVGNAAFLPHRIAVFALPAKDVVFRTVGEEEPGAGALPLVGINHRNNDVAPLGVDGVRVGDFFVVGESAKCLRYAAPTFKKEGIVLVLRTGVGRSQEREDIRGMFIVPCGEAEEKGLASIDLASYFRRRVPLSLCGGAFELAVCLLSLYCVHGHRNYQKYLSMTEKLILVKSVSTPNVSVTIEKISFLRTTREEKTAGGSSRLLVSRKLVSDPEPFSFTEEMSELALNLDQTLFIPDGELMLGGRRGPGGRGADPRGVFAHYLEGRKVGSTYLEKELVHATPEPLKAEVISDPATDWMGFCLGSEIATHLSPRAELLGGRAPLKDYLPLRWSAATSTRVPLMSRMMDLQGARVTVPRMVSDWDTGFVNGMVFVASEMLLPGETAVIITTNSVAVEARPEMVEAMEAFREAAKIGGGCRVGRIGRLNASIVLEQRGRSPVSRESFLVEKGRVIASAALTKPTEIRSSHAYYGLPICLPNEMLERKEDRDRQWAACAKANSLVLTSANFFQFDVKGKAKLKETRRLAVPWPEVDTIAGIPVQKVSGVRIARLARIGGEGGSRVVAQFSEVPRFRHPQTGQRILARLAFRSSVDVGDMLLSQVYGRRTKFELGEEMLRMASDEPFTLFTGPRRPIPSDEGTQVAASFIEQSMSDATSSSALGDRFIAIDTEGTRMAHQLYRRTGSGLEVALCSSLLRIDSRRLPFSPDDAKLSQRVEDGFREVGEARLCWVFQLDLVETQDPVLREVRMEGMVDVNVVYTQLYGHRKATHGPALLRYCSERINRWAEAASQRDSRALLSWTPPRGETPRWEWRVSDGEMRPETGTFRMTAMSTAITQLNYFVLLQATETEAESVRAQSSRWMRAATHMTRLGDKAPAEEEKDGFIRDIYGNYSPIDEELREHLERAEAALAAEDKRRRMIRSAITDALQELADKDGGHLSVQRQMSVLSRWGWHEEAILDLFFTEDGYRLEQRDTDEVFPKQIASTSRVLTDLAPSEPIPEALLRVEDEPGAREAFAERSMRLIVREGAPFPKELHGTLETDPVLYWERSRWGFNFKKQLLTLLGRWKMDAPTVSFTVRQGVWICRLSHVFGDSEASDSKKGEAEKRAYRNWLAQNKIPSIQSAAIRDVCYEIFDSSRASLYPADKGLMMCGLDTERDPSGELTVVQIAAMDPTGAIKVFIWVRTEESTKCPEWVCQILADQRWAKCAFDQSEDRRALNEAGLRVDALFELQEIPRERGWGRWGLAAVVRTLVGMEMDKNRDIRVSFTKGLTWDSLSPAQRRYAAEDAVASLLLGPFLSHLSSEVTRSRFFLYDGADAQRLWYDAPVRGYDGPPFQSGEVRYIYSRELLVLGSEIVVVCPKSAALIRLVGFSVLEEEKGREWKRYQVSKKMQVREEDIYDHFRSTREAIGMLPQSYVQRIFHDDPRERREEATPKEAVLALSKPRWGDDDEVDNRIPEISQELRDLAVRGRNPA